ncbi:PC4/YdbC family ssDNA-binding protein [Neobacillus drentensis]|uniref:YdbC family protein n=1 Tax=Neobacillus drentensis TaxID=220684 RepID=UPI002FFF22B4
MAEIKFEIKETIGAISQSPKGWSKELNLISWNGKEPKYDLLERAPDHEKMGKGVTLTVEELKSLRDLLNGIIIGSGIGVISYMGWPLLYSL